MLAILAEPLSARRIWKFGGIYVPDIFSLLLPGIDLNDPSKTGLSCMAISNMVDLIHLSDISEVDETDTSAPGDRALRKVPRVSVQDDTNEPVQLDISDLTPEEVNARIRFATSTFRDWVPEFIGRILLLFANLPEEGGKSGKAGGKTEQLTLMSVLVSTVLQ
jgi:proteasome activator subunit 4